MKEKIANLWINHLCSNHYNQGFYYLISYQMSLGKQDDCYHCALGVLCDIAVQEGVIEPATLLEDLSDNTEYVMGYLDEFEDKGYSYSTFRHARLPTKVVEWAGMRSDTGKYPGWFTSRSIMNDNDTKGMSFQQIAKVIENKWKKL